MLIKEVVYFVIVIIHTFKLMYRVLHVDYSLPIDTNIPDKISTKS